MIFKRLSGLLLVTIISLWAQENYLDLYQKKGIEAVEKALDSELEREAYWSKEIGDKNVSKGYFSSYDTVLYCEKRNGQLKRYRLDAQHRLSLEHNNSTLTGKKEGDKLREGDLKTPVGVYKLVDRLTKLDQYYGPMALVTNYPNNYDQALNKTGSGIWIHGVPLKGDRDDATKGCLAIDNKEIVALNESMDYTKAALIIAEEHLARMTKEEAIKILAFLYKWRNSWKYGDYETYIENYAPNFKRANGLNLHQFKRIKAQIFARNEKKRIDLTHINVIPYPNNENKRMFVIQFIEDYATKYTTYFGHKELYVVFENNQIQIVSES